MNQEAFSNNNFFKDLKTALQILVSIDILIVKYQSDRVPVSEVLPDFHALPEELQKLYAANLKTEDELNYLVMLTVKHFQFVFGVAPWLELHARSMQSWSQYAYTIMPQSGEHSV